jgi:3-phosphoshikimate 1-carboxyvinyltransferase
MNVTAAKMTSGDLKLEPASKFTGHYTPPPDKSIAHRALILAAMATGRSTIEPISRSEDVASTAACLRQLGVSIEQFEQTWVVESPGFKKWNAPERALDCGNSGTTMRLLTGCLAGQTFESTLIGDDSLTQRPMKRIALPLRQMGARIELSESDTAPIHIIGTPLRGIEYHLPVASAQVKSAILLAGLNAEGATVIYEDHVSRDHTERMLGYAEVDCHSEAPPRPTDRREMLAAMEENGDIPEPADYHRRITLGDAREVKTADWRIPGDFSAAAFMIVAAIGTRKAELIVGNAGTNPSRTGLLKILRRMGATVEVERGEQGTGEPSGTLRVKAAKSLKAVKVGKAEVPGVIDELPILAVLAARAEGITVIRGAEELRHKESDRIAAVTHNLRAMGAKVAELEDGWAIEGPTEWHGATIDPRGDHRVAMAFSVAALWADGPTIIEHAEVARISDPDFYYSLTALAR